MTHIPFHPLRISAIILFILASFNLQAQEVQWATEVKEVSSEMTPFEYAARQALGKPNVLPNAGINPAAWTPKNPNRFSFIKVGFDEPMKIQQVAIAESFNPSAVYEIMAYDENDKEYVLATLEPGPIDDPGRMLNVFVDKTKFKVSAIGIALDGKKVPGYSSIDAIAISSSREPVSVEMNINSEVNPSLEVEKLSEKINSPYPEMKPLVSPDGDVLYFSRRNHPGNIGGEDDKEDIWFARKDPSNGEWMEAENLGEPLNNEGPNFISSLTPDGKNMIVVLGNEYHGRNKDKMKSGISRSRLTSEGWSEPENIDIKNLNNFSEHAHFYMANNQRVMLMSVERPDTKGKMDLYVSFREDDGSWTEPKNLGDDVNTINMETSPFLAADDKTMYFTSDGFSGFGGSDVYVTRRLDDTWTNWSEPQNLGPDINGPEDDEFFTMPPSGDYIYYSRGGVEDDEDIYRISLPDFFRPEPVVTVYGKVFNAKTNKPIEAQIFYETLPEGEDIGFTVSDPRTGEYEITLPGGALYGYLAESDGYIAINQNIDLKNLENYREVKQNLYLVPIETGQVVTLNNIFFDFDKATLRPESYPELDRVVEALKKNPDMNIQISGHTDAIGTKAYNQDLSMRRAKSVQEYLTNKGIDKDRLKLKGYGESKPIASNEKSNGRQLNRRVEFKILD